MKETLKQGGYKDIQSVGHKEFILIDENGKKELWFSNKNHASYGIIYKNTHLEFIRSI